MVRAVAATGEMGEALHILENAGRERGGECDLQLLKGDLLHEAGREEEAVAEYRAAAESAPDDQEPLLRLAELCFDIQDYKRALVIFSDAITLMPAEPLAYYLRAGLYRRIGRDDLARADELTAVALRRCR